MLPDQTDNVKTQRATLEAHARRSGLNDDDIAEARYLHRMTVVGAFPTPENGGLPGRPGVTVPDMPGLFVAGDWVGPDGFLADASIASGHAAGQAAGTAAKHNDGRNAK